MRKNDRNELNLIQTLTNKFEEEYPDLQKDCVYSYGISEGILIAINHSEGYMYCYRPVEGGKSILQKRDLKVSKEKKEKKEKKK